MKQYRSNVFLYFSRNPGENYRHLQKFHRAVAANDDFDFCVISFVPGCQEHVRALTLNGIQVTQHIYSEDSLVRLSYPRKISRENFRLIPGNADVPALLFWLDHTGYDRYWIVEDDVDYSGDIRELLQQVSMVQGDLLATHLTKCFESWDYFSRFYTPSADIQLNDMWLCFLPFTVVREKALRAIHESYMEGWDGHPEMLWATVLLNRGFSVTDIGGRGSYVAPENIDRFYSGLVGDTSFQKHGSFGTKTIRLRPGRTPNLLWHPVKTFGYWVQARRKRLLSMAHWLAYKIKVAFFAARDNR